MQTAVSGCVGRASGARYLAGNVCEGASQCIQEIVRVGHSAGAEPCQAGLPSVILNAVLNDESQPRLPVQFAGQIAKTLCETHCIGRTVASRIERHQASRRFNPDDEIPRHGLGLTQNPDHKSTDKLGTAAGRFGQIGEGKKQCDNALQRRPFLLHRPFPIHHMLSDQVRKHCVADVGEGDETFFVIGAGPRAVDALSGQPLQVNGR
jgi:hypothetical protein